MERQITRVKMMNGHSLKLLFLLSIGAWMFSGCYYDREHLLYPTANDCSWEQVSFTADVLPLLNAQCNSCHGGASPQGGINLDSYSAVSGFASNGVLSCSIHHTGGCSPMPQNANKLSPCNLKLIDQWISEGVLDN
jgi:hypothetical protein